MEDSENHRKIAKQRATILAQFKSVAAAMEEEYQKAIDSLNSALFADFEMNLNEALESLKSERSQAEIFNHELDQLRRECADMLVKIHSST